MTAFLRWWFIVTAALLVTAGSFALLFFVAGLRSPTIGFVNAAVTFAAVHTLIYATRPRHD